LRWSDIQFDPSRTTLRQFAGLGLVFFGGFALWQAMVRGHTTLAAILAILAVTIGLLGWARPQWVRWIYVGWMVLAFPIGWTISQIMLAVMFFGLFAPIGLVFQLVGRDPLRRARCPDRESFWEPKPEATDVGRYFKQY
jgi:hypothetical protein